MKSVSLDCKFIVYTMCHIILCVFFFLSDTRDLIHVSGTGRVSHMVVLHLILFPIIICH